MRDRRTLLSLKICKAQIINDIICQSSLLCEDYIYNRLRHQKELEEPTNNNPDNVTDQSGENNELYEPTDVSLEIQRIGSMLESQYPSLYCKISRKIMMPLRSEVSVRKALICIGDSMFNNFGITWTRIVALFAVAGAMAAECVELGNSGHIGEIVTVFSELIERHASKWILRQGGWVGVVTAFRSRTEVQDMCVLGAVGLVIGFSFTWSLLSRVISD